MHCHGNVMEAEGVRDKYSLPEQIIWLRIIINLTPIIARSVRHLLNSFQFLLCLCIATSISYMQNSNVSAVWRMPSVADNRIACVQKKIRFVLPKCTLKIRDSRQNKHLLSLYHIMHELGLKVS